MARSMLTDPLTPLNTQPAGLTGMGDPVFSDEFVRGGWDNGKWLPWYPDTEFWNKTVPGGHKTNSFEPQGYDASGLQMLPDKGIRLTFRESNEAVPELPYSSGMLCSYESFSQSYGVFEARMKLANVTGSWAAFWMHGMNMVWPPEIDIMESWGRESYNGGVHHTYHYPRVPGAPTGYSASHVQVGNGDDVGNAFHNYAVIWEPGRIRWLCDGVVTKDLVSDYINSNPMYMILNNAGDKDSANPGAKAPWSIDIEHVRVWTLDGTLEPEPEPETPTGVFAFNGSPLTPKLLTNDTLVTLAANTFKE